MSNHQSDRVNVTEGPPETRGRRLETSQNPVSGLNLSDRVEGLLQQLLDRQARMEQLLLISENEHTSRLALSDEQHMAFSVFLLQKAALLDIVALRKDEAVSFRQLFDAPSLFTIDPTTPHPKVVFEDPYTAAKVNGKICGWVTLRTAKALSPTNHRWAVKIHRMSVEIALGMLPKLSSVDEANMGKFYVASLGGWCMYIAGSGKAALSGGLWTCPPITCVDGDVVAFDYSFVEKTLTIRCGDHAVVGHIPSIKDDEELYPAFSMQRPNAKLSFVTYPEELMK